MQIRKLTPSRLFCCCCCCLCVTTTSFEICGRCTGYLHENSGGILIVFISLSHQGRSKSQEVPSVIRVQPSSYTVGG